MYSSSNKNIDVSTLRSNHTKYGRKVKYNHIVVQERDHYVRNLADVILLIVTYNNNYCVFDCFCE